MLHVLPGNRLVRHVAVPPGLLLLYARHAGRATGFASPDAHGGASSAGLRPAVPAEAGPVLPVDFPRERKCRGDSWERVVEVVGQPGGAQTSPVGAERGAPRGDQGAHALSTVPTATPRRSLAAEGREVRAPSGGGAGRAPGSVGVKEGSVPRHRAQHPQLLVRDAAVSPGGVLPLRLQLPVVGRHLLIPAADPSRQDVAGVLQRTGNRAPPLEALGLAGLVRIGATPQ